MKSMSACVSGRLSGQAILKTDPMTEVLNFTCCHSEIERGYQDRHFCLRQRQVVKGRESWGGGGGSKREREKERERERERELGKDGMN